LKLRIKHAVEAYDYRKSLLNDPLTGLTTLKSELSSASLRNWNDGMLEKLNDGIALIVDEFHSWRENEFVAAFKHYPAFLR
jgi:hypothetical protein